MENPCNSKSKEPKNAMLIAQHSTQKDAGAPLLIYKAVGADSHHIQIGVFHGGIDGCPEPGIFVRLDNRKIWEFIDQVIGEDVEKRPVLQDPPQWGEFSDDVPWLELILE